MGNWDRLLKNQRLIDPLIGTALFVGSFLIYLQTLAPSVATIFDDSLEFQLVCYQPGIAHPTGYPLYTLLGKLFTFLPVGDVAYRVNLMSAFFASITVGLMYAILKLMTKQRAPAILGAATFAVSAVFWSQAVIAEVYVLNAAFMALTLVLLLAWVRSYEEPHVYSQRALWRPDTILSVLALVYGLALTHHRTMLLLAPVLVIVVFAVDRRIFTRGRLLARLILLFLAPLCLYLYIPLRASTLSPLDGAYQSTLQGFVNYVTARPYVKMFVSENPVQENRDLTFYFDLLRAQFTWAGIALGVLGVVWSFRRRKMASLLVIAFAIIAIFVAGYHVPDIEVFLIPVFLIWALWIGNGFAALWESFTGLWERWAGHRTPRAETTLYLLLLVGASSLPLYLWQANRAENDMSRRWDVHDYGEDMLNQPLEKDAVVAGILGEMTLLNYFQQTEGLRPDLVTISANKEKRRLDEVRTQMQTGHAVYLTRPLRGVEDEYQLSSVGPLIQVRERPAEISRTPSHPLSVLFGEEILLAGYDAYLRDLHVGQSLRITLFWQATGEISDDYKVSVRLLDAEGHLGGVEEAFPVRDAYRTAAWRPGETIIDSYDLPIVAGLPPGSYTIQATMYQPDTLAPVASAPLGSILLEGDMDLERAGPWDVEHKVMVDLGHQLKLLGYSIIGQGFGAGETIPLTFLWQALGEPGDEYHLEVWLEDQGGARWGQVQLPLGGDYPPSRWQRGQIVRDWQALPVPGHLQEGLYHVKMQVLAGQRVLDRVYGFLPAGTVLDLGQIEVMGRERSFTVPDIQQPLQFRLGETVMLLGYDLEATSVRPGEDLRLVLYWQCLGLMDTSYTVFVHLLDEEGNIRGQQDSIPGWGMLPTTSWAESEVIVDKCEVLVALDAPPGPYTIAVGLYDAPSGGRLPIYDEQSRPIGDHLLLRGIEILAD
jgi:hypothetical protein